MLTLDETDEPVIVDEEHRKFMSDPDEMPTLWAVEIEVNGERAWFYRYGPWYGKGSKAGDDWDGR